MKSLRQYCEEAHRNACEKGFHDQDKINLNLYIENATTDKESLDRIYYMQSLNMIKDIALVITELSEAIEFIRKDQFAKDNIWKETFEEEVADTFIRLFDLCGCYEIDIEKYINLKMEYNKGREVLHGKKI